MPTIPYGGEGVPAGTTTQEFSHVELLHNSQPQMADRSYTADGSVALPAFSVVGTDDGTREGTLIAATTGSVDPADDVQPIGITLSPVLANGQPQSLAVAFAGNFNIAALFWDASFDTEAKQLSAFDGAPAPTNIVTGKTKG